MKAALSTSEAGKIRKKLSPTPEQMEAIAAFVLHQIHRRYETSGASGNEPWVKNVFDTGKKPLEGLAKTWRSEVIENEAMAICESWIAKRMQEGTVGKGGSNPDIVPKNIGVKALYIPITEVGRQAYIAFKAMSPVSRSIYRGYSSIEMPVADKARFIGMPIAKYGVDYIFAKSSKLAPRNQMPTSDIEKAELRAFIRQTLMAKTREEPERELLTA